MKYWELEIDGTDKVGKDTVLQYLANLGNYKYSINSRGLMSQLVYNKKFNRDYKYDLSTFNKNKVIIWLYADPNDLEIRCKLTNEPKYSIVEDTDLFAHVYQELMLDDYIIYKYNTSRTTAYDIAIDIIYRLNQMEELNNE